MKSANPLREMLRKLSAKPVSVVQLKFAARVAIALAVGCVSLAAVYRHAARMSSIEAGRRQRAAANVAAAPELSAENTIPGTYTTFEIAGAGTGALQGTVAFGMDSAGDITGPYLDTNRVAHGYLRLANGTETKFDVPGAGNLPPANLGDSGGGGLLLKNQGTIPVGINGGVVVGTYTDDNLAYHGFVRAANGTISKFDVPGAIAGAGAATYEEGTKAIGVNASGTIVGTYVDSNQLYHGFLRSAAGVLTKFDVPGAGSGPDGAGGTMPVSINASGDVTGVFTGSDSFYHAFLRKASGTFVTFDPPDAKPANDAEGNQYAGTIAFAINDSGEIAGTYVDANWVRHGFLRSASGTFTEFEAPGAGSTMTPFTSPTGLLEGTGAVAIDPAGDVAGMYLDANLAYHGFVRYANGEIATFDAPGANTTMLHGTGAFAINATGAIAGTYVDSNFVAHGFLLSPGVTATPTFSPAAGTYTSAQTVAIADGTPGATIYYTLDGSAPTGQSPKYSTPLTVIQTTTIHALAEAADYANSAVAAATYTITPPQTAAPAFSPAAGVYMSAQTVTLTDATKGAAIYYTLNGSTPTTGSTLYTRPLTVSKTTTIEAIAAATGYAGSSVASATYTIDVPVAAATPTATPAAGAYGEEQLVALASSTPGATIYYTTNATAPTTSSTKYTGPIPVDATETITAIAVASGYTDSPELIAGYTVAGSPQVLTGVATSVAATSAALNATVSTGAQTQAWFVWGLTKSALNESTAKATLAASGSAQIVSATITGLTAKTTYYFQPVAASTGGESYGAMQSFTTP